MKVTLNTSIASLGAQRQLGRLDSEIGSVFERLSTGLRINQAADDPAGLSIAEILKLNNIVLNQGVKNLNDGISLLNIADTAVQQLTTITSRIMELAEQAANGSLGNDQRGAIDNEAQELSKEFTRIVQTTEFNGIGLLNGELGDGIALQAGFGEQGQIVGGLGGATGTGEFDVQPSFSVGGSPTGAVTADLNNDGLLDLIAVNQGPDTMSVMLGTGNGNFGSISTYSTGANPRDVTTADVNGDGILDLAVANYTSGDVDVFLGVGDGSFGVKSTHSVGNWVSSIVSGDFNSDGYADLATSDLASNQMSILLSNGDGTFQSSAAYPTGNFPTGINTGDLDGDGFLDLVVTRYGTTLATVYMGAGDGTFNSPATYGVGNAAEFVTIGDFNGDGHADLATADSGDDTVSVLLGVGDGSFGTRTAYSLGGTPEDITSGDFNGDGFLDLATSNRGDNTVSVLLGAGDGTFNPESSIAVAGGPDTILTGDFDGDGVPDLLSINTFGSTANLLLGGTIDGVAPLLPFSLATQADALQAMAPLRNKLNLLNQQRGEIGAFQGRIEAGMRALEVTALENKAAEARIRDADVATETASLVRLQIAQQAAAAVLAQANTTGAIALQLIGEG